mgnify:FL=1|jgi:hypothetical protein|tara:strand:+ start:1441 stop:2304 length:864 start_codon:yes stop_codon:yes gene_type:complete
MSSLDAVLAQYEKNKQTTGSSKPMMSQEDRLKQYLSIMLPKGTKSGEKTIRILPTQDGSSPFKEVYFHNIQVQGRWTKLYDPGKNQEGKPSGDRSPLNEVEEALRLAGDAQSKELARSYRSQKFYIVKIIDRDNEEDGVKFWRFKHNWKGDGPIDKIIPIWQKKGDVTDVNEGRDLTLMLQAVPLPGGRGEYTTVSTVMYEDPTQLSDIAQNAKDWTEDERTWKDVYSQKPVEYLEAIAKGLDPVWDSELKKYVYDDPNAVKNTTDTTVLGSTDPQANQKVDEDLPF